MSDKQAINNPLILGSLAGNGAAPKAVGGRAGVSIRREMSEKENVERRGLKAILRSLTLHFDCEVARMWDELKSQVSGHAPVNVQ